MDIALDAALWGLITWLVVRWVRTTQGGYCWPLLAGRAESGNACGGAVSPAA